MMVTLPPQAHAERQSWLVRVRDKLNAQGIMVAACDLGRRTCGEVVEAERWADKAGPTQAAPRWLWPFFREPGETILETRRRARAERRGAA